MVSLKITNWFIIKHFVHIQRADDLKVGVLEELDGTVDLNEMFIENDQNLKSSQWIRIQQIFFR